MYDSSIRTSPLFGNEPVDVCPLYDGIFGSKLYRYPSSLISLIDLYGYNSEIIGFNSSVFSNGINTDTLLLGNPNPPLTKTLPVITP